jgi:hypothetical protein
MKLHLNSCSEETKSHVNINETNSHEKNYITRLKWKKNLQESEITNDLYLCYLPLVNRNNYRDVLNSVCDICKDKLTYTNDSIVVCELCYTATHQSCYGGELLDEEPKEKWYCQRCKYLLKKNLAFDAVTCCLCPKDELQGIIKKIDEQKNLWAHVECVNWTPEIYFDNKKKENVSCYDMLNPERINKLICKFCKRNEGSCIQCDYSECLQAFHIRCAKNSDVIKNWMIMQDYELDG